MSELDVQIVGREKEICSLQDIYKQCLYNGQVVWISGVSGVGKSALIQKFLHDRKYVCSGKFDFVKSSAPFSVIIKILHELCSFLEVENVLVSVGPEVISILSKLLPQIRNVIAQLDFEGGLDRIVESKNGEWVFQKLKQATRVFIEASINAISSVSKIPVIFHFDDLQWADEASLEIIKALFDGNDVVKQFICIVSYRDNEVDEMSPFSRCQAFINDSKYSCSVISIGNLKPVDVVNLVLSQISLPYEQAEYLGRLIYDVTQGNSLFVRRYLSQMIKKKLIRKSKSGHGWEIDDSTIRAEVNEGEDICSFIRQEISNLPPLVSEVLKISSLLGQEIDISLLKSVLLGLTFDFSTFSFHGILDCLESKCLIVIKIDKKSFHFVHDRVYQAAYNLSLQEHDIPQLSLRIGRLILDIKDECQDSRSMFKLLLAIDQMNRGSSLIDTIEGKEELARLNLTAAKEVLRVNAFKLAQTHLEKSLEVLGEKCWEIYYDLTLEISNLLASVLLGNGLMSQSTNLIDHICENSKCSDDRRDAQIVKLEILACTNHLDQCLEFSQEMLAELQLSPIPCNPGLRDIIIAMASVQRLLRPLSSEDILNLPICNDCKIQHAMKIFGVLCPVAFFASKESIVPIIICRMMYITLKYGLTDLSPYALSCFGICMTARVEFKEAFRFGSLALKMMERFGEDARTLVAVYGIFYHTQRHVVDILKPTLRAYYISFVQGDLVFSGQAIAMHILARMAAGSSLEYIISDTFTFSEQLKTYNQTLMWNILMITQRSNLELADRSSEIIKFIGEYPDDDAFQTYLVGEHAEFHDLFFSIFTLRSRLIIGDKESALVYAKKCWRSKGFRAAFLFSVAYFFYSALMAIQCWRESFGVQKFQLWRIFRRFQRLLVVWTEKGNPNTLHLVSLLNAEVLSSKKNADLETCQEAYHLSITQATRLGFLHDAALGNELLGKFCLKKRELDLAKHNLERAKVLYFDWGAFKKVKQMEWEYGSLVENKISTDQLSTAFTGRARDGIVSEIENVRSITRLSLEEK